jgi:hypothetical protein
MHSQQFVRIINEVTSQLGIATTHFSDNWAIKLSKLQTTEYIVGYTFPLNNATTFKILRNKNLCSEILSTENVPNVPHQVIFHPSVKRVSHTATGNSKDISDFLTNYNFPIVIKRNKTSGGQGVFIVQNISELETILLNIFSKDNVLCLCPYRNILHEYRNIILNGNCLLTYEKLKPHLIGDGEKRVIDLLADHSLLHQCNKFDSDIFDDIFKNKLFYVPCLGEIVYLKWKHNTTFGSTYSVVNNPQIKQLALEASSVVNSSFVSTDIIFSKEFGYEILEINASVVLDSYSIKSEANYQQSISIYKAAMEKIFADR